MVITYPKQFQQGDLSAFVTHCCQGHDANVNKVPRKVAPRYMQRTSNWFRPVPPTLSRGTGPFLWNWSSSLWEETPGELYWHYPFKELFSWKGPWYLLILSCRVLLTTPSVSLRSFTMRDSILISIFILMNGPLVAETVGFLALDTNFQVNNRDSFSGVQLMKALDKHDCKFCAPSLHYTTSETHFQCLYK